MTEPSSSGDPRDWSKAQAELGQLLAAVHALDARVQRLEAAAGRTAGVAEPQGGR